MSRGYLHIAIGIRDFDVALARVNRNVSPGVANFDAPCAAGDAYRRGHVRDADAAPIPTDCERRLCGHRDFQIQAEARIDAASRTDFEAVAILHDLDGSALCEL